MQSSSRHIITVGASLGCLSMLYFVAFAWHLPFILAIVFIGAAMILVARQFRAPQAENAAANPVVSWIVLLAGAAVIVARSYSLALEYGGWDAWCVWNLHAKYLSGDLDNWQNLFLNVFADHTDYPLLVPGVNGFFMKVLPAGTAVIPFVFSFAITLCIPVLIYLEAVKRNVWVAALFLIPFAADRFYLFSGLSQYADIVLAFFFLAATICIDNAREDNRYVALAAICLGCCIWTKNEGVILAALAFAFNARVFLSWTNLKYLVAGMALPLLAYAIFKFFYAPQNDLVSSWRPETWQQVYDVVRYKVIFRYFTAQLRTNFIYLDIAFVLYVVSCIVRRQLPGRQFLMIIACMVVYLTIYVFTSQNLEWHLETSLERLMLQLMPALMYVIAQRLATISDLQLKKETL